MRTDSEEDHRRRNPELQEIARAALRRLSVGAESFGASTSEVLNNSVTHVVAYHGENQQLCPDCVLKRYSLNLSLVMDSTEL